MEKVLLLRPAEAATALGVSRSKIYELLQTNAIPKVIVGKSVRIPSAALQRWIDAQLKDGPEAA